MTDKRAEETLFNMRQEYARLEEEDSTLKKRKDQLSHLMEDWEQLNKAELEILEEVHFLSQGTHSEAHALRSVDEREHVTKQGQLAIDTEIEHADFEERKIKNKLDELESDIDRQKKAVYEHA